MERVINEAYEKIKLIKIQGATNIALFALQTIEAAAGKQKLSWQDIFRISKKLALARDNEPLTRNVLSMLLGDLKDDTSQPAVKKAAAYYKNLIKTNKKKMAETASALINNQGIYLSHCHSTSLEKAFITAYQQGKRFSVWQTETRPLYQGRVTAVNLFKAGIPVRLIVDDTAAWLISVYDDVADIQAVFAGADVLCRDGWVINKVGTYGLALAAHEAGIPFYVVASLLKFQNQKGSEVKIELRPTKEVWFKKPKGLKVVNLAFDKTPAKFITGLATEAGLIKPEEVYQKAKEFYPGLQDRFNES